MALLETFIPSFVNGLSSLFNISSQEHTNADNREFYMQSQARANRFAKGERLAAQEYNSPVNQLHLMQQAGMNPNLLTGTAFNATSPVSNQSVSPPLAIAPSLPSETSSQSAVNVSSAKDLQSQQASRDAVLDGIIRMNHAQADYLVQNTKVGEWTVRQIEQSIDESNARMGEISAKIANIWENTRLMRSQRRGQDIQNEWLPKISDAQVMKAVADAKVAREQIPFFRAQATYIGQLARNMALQNDIGEANKWFTIQLGRQAYEKGKAEEFIMKINRNKVAYDFGWHKTFYPIQQGLELGSSTLNVLGQIFDNLPYTRMLNNVKGLIPFTSAPSQ